MEKFLEVNLLYGSEERRKREYLIQVYKKITIFFLLLIPIGIGSNIFLNLRIRYLKSKLSEIEKELEKTAKLLEKREYLLGWKESYEEIFNFFRNIFKRPIKWSIVLERFSELTPEEIWFTKMSMDKNKNLQINACVGFLEDDKKMLNKINEFIENIKKDRFLRRYFKEVALKDVNKKTASQLEMEFKIILKEK